MNRTLNSTTTCDASDHISVITSKLNASKSKF